MKRPAVFDMEFRRLYPLYVDKATKKSRTKGEVDEVIFWLTGYDKAALQKILASDINLEAFFANAPQINPNATLIKGLVCGVRVEEIQDKLMWQIRCLDKLVDELAKGKSMDKILRCYVLQEPI